MAYELKDYNEVVDRVRAFNDKFPEGAIQTEITHLSEKLVIVRASAFRDREDPKPSIAHSQLGIPGTTNFTRGSEVENAETSAVGRALSFMGFAAKKSLASKDEIENKRQDPPEKPPTTPKIENKQWMKDFNVLAKESGSSIREAMKLGEQANLLVEMDKWQKGNGYSDDEALEEAKKLVVVK